MQTISTRKAIKILELWQNEDARVVLVAETGDPAAVFDLRLGKIQVRDDMGGLIIHISGETTSTAIRPDRFEGIILVRDESLDDDFAAMRFVAGYGMRDVVLLAVGADYVLDPGALILLAALTDGVADTEEEEPEESQEGSQDQEEQDTEGPVPAHGIPWWPPQTED